MATSAKKRKLLALLDEAVRDSKFPFWDLGEENSLVVRMQVSGWRSASGIALMFETFGYSDKESTIQTLAFLFSTFETNTWLKSESIFLDRIFFQLNNNALEGTVQVLNKDIYFNTNKLDKYDVKKEFKLPLSVLLALSDELSDAEIFSTPVNLKKLFAMPGDAECIFQTKHWKHSTFEDYWEFEKLPSRNRDFIAMANSLAEGNKLHTPNKSNTSWKIQSKKIVINGKWPESS